MSRVSEVASIFTKPPFRRGKKEIWLPSFAIVLRRTNTPRHATFSVPLWFSKLDLRDYLFSVYNVRIFNVRSYVRLSPITQGNPKDKKLVETNLPQQRRWFRAQSTKTMTVELEQPFIWPEEPEDFEPWHKTQKEKIEKSDEEQSKSTGSLKDTIVDTKNRTAMREQAQALLDGKTKWEPHLRDTPGAMTVSARR